ncbi:MAG: ATP-binding protein [Elusimicrobia bacterium]|nr:ATP-binding protein [Elusimicrobiota bacterium]
MVSNLSGISRVLKIDLSGNNAAFLWGPRKTGKTTLLKQLFPEAKYYDLLDTELKTRLLVRPALLREQVLAQNPRLVVLDEIQKVPSLLDEVHWCLENTKTKFVLCGSSARKLRRAGANLLGGRAWRFEMFPLTTAEVPDADLDRILNHGLLPKHYLEEHPERSLSGYVFDYLEEEILEEALTRRVPNFAKFLEAVAASHGQLINYSNVARDCGVSCKTAREYFQVLEDTLLGHALEPWRKRRKRRLIETAKFYLFDVGLVRALNEMRPILRGTEEHGRAFEHFLIEEIRAYLSYSEKRIPIFFWRTSTGLEVDLVAGDLDLAVEFKAVPMADERHAKGLRALHEERKVRKRLVISLDDEPRRLADGTDILPWRAFCRGLWSGEWI